MGREYRAKVFKSGNSLALRLPKALGLKEGSTMVLREERAGFVAEAEEAPAKRLDVGAFWGKEPGLVPPPRIDFEDRPSTIARRKAKRSQ